MKVNVSKEALKRIIELAERSTELNASDNETLASLKEICQHKDDSIKLIVENEYDLTVLWEAGADIENLLSNMLFSEDEEAVLSKMTDEERNLFVSDVSSYLDWEEIESACCVKGNDFIEEAIGVVLSERLAIRTAELLGWNVTRYKDYYSVAQESPAGEDFSFDAAVGSFKRDVMSYAYMFDAEEHAEMWVNASSSVSGVPSIFELCEDAKAIEKMLNELSEAIH